MLNCSRLLTHSWLEGRDYHEDSLRLGGFGLDLGAFNGIGRRTERKVSLKDKDSNDVGSATLTQTPAGVLIALSVKVCLPESTRSMSTASGNASRHSCLPAVT